MSGPPLNGNFNECEQCGRSLSARTAELSDARGCVFCRGDDE